MQNSNPLAVQCEYSLERSIFQVFQDLSKNTRLCSEHFTPDRYERDFQTELLGSKKRASLNADAVPSILESFSTNDEHDYEFSSFSYLYSGSKK